MAGDIPGGGLIRANANLLFTPRLKPTGTHTVTQRTGLDTLTLPPFEPREIPSLDSILTDPRLSPAARGLLDAAGRYALSLNGTTVETVHLALAFLQLPEFRQRVGESMGWQSSDEAYSQITAVAVRRRKNGLPEPTESPLYISNLVEATMKTLMDSTTGEMKVEPQDIFQALFANGTGTMGELRHRERR